ncbi:phosphotransferase enzyme family protein [Subtercola sp. YIM 133946]|uniref:phosphotransferase enzyme family protein n=1 Tax=Subtercola sp. YIM 133946 TaxID=3118909 RepID=UPI002F952120
MTAVVLDANLAERIVRLALPYWKIADDAVVVFVKHRENVVFRIIDAEQQFAVRLHRPGYRSDAEILTEVRHIAALGEHGMSVPFILVATTGSPLVHVLHGGIDFQLDAQRWLVGSAPMGDIDTAFAGTTTLTTTDFRALGRVAAQLHETTQQVGKVPGYTRGAWDAAGLVGPTPLWGDPLELRDNDMHDRAVLTQTITALRVSLGQASTRAAVYGPVHADFTPENVLVVDGRLVVIDFDDFGDGWNMFDLATILFFYTPDPRYPSFRSAMLAGYTSVRPLQHDEPALLDDLLIARGLTYLGWTGQRRDEDGMEFLATDVRRHVIALATEYLDSSARQTRT